MPPHALADLGIPGHDDFDDLPRPRRFYGLRERNEYAGWSPYYEMVEERKAAIRNAEETVQAWLKSKGVDE